VNLSFEGIEGRSISADHDAVHSDGIVWGDSSVEVLVKVKIL
jgi:hypothetical protein